MSVIAPCPFSAAGPDDGRRSALRAAPKAGFVLVASLLALFAGPLQCLGDETNATLTAPSQIEDTNTQAILQAFVQLQQQLHTAQLAIEQNRQEIKESTAQHAEALSTALQTVQDNFTAQRAHDLQIMQQHNKVVLILVSAFAGMGFLTMLMMSYFQWRMSRGLAEISAALPAALGLAQPPAAAALGPGERSSSRLIGPMPPQQKRVHPAAPNPRLAEAQPYPDPETAFRRRQLRALRTAVIVGLVCAAALALLFYFVSHRKLGFGYLHGWFPT